MDKHELKDDSELPDYFVTAQTLDYKNRIYMQSIWQSHIDASISSTVNVPNDFTVEQVEDLYMTAWDAGLKGVTIFRDGCKRAGILTTTIKEKDTKPADVKPHTLERGMIIKADDNCIGKKPPCILYHGTGEKYVTSIDQNGLIPKSRLYVHLSKDVETAKAVGKRHGKEVVYSINSEQMYKDGYKFYLSKNGVWLTKRVPVKYLMKEV